MHPLGPGCGGDPTVAVLCGAAARSVGSGMDLGLQVGFSVGGKAPEPDGQECRLLADAASSQPVRAAFNLCGATDLGRPMRELY